MTCGSKDLKRLRLMQEDQRKVDEQDKGCKLPGLFSTNKSLPRTRATSERGRLGEPSRTALQRPPQT